MPTLFAFGRAKAIGAMGSAIKLVYCGRAFSLDYRGWKAPHPAPEGAEIYPKFCGSGVPAAIISRQDAAPTEKFNLRERRSSALAAAGTPIRLCARC
jgi:hypothetical protein